MNALLIWPEIPLTYWGGQYATRLISKKAFMPPLGLLTVAALCPAEWNLRLIDLNVEELSDADLKWADLALVSGMAIQERSMLDSIGRCKNAGITTIAGGPDVTSSPDKFADVTYLLLDEAEITLPLFLRDFAAGCPQRVYTASGVKPDITQTPVPRFDLLKIDAYAHMCVQFTRGCPFACEFCDITTLYGRIPRAKNPEQIVNELETIYNLGFRGELFLVDDNFIGNKKAVKAMLPALITWMSNHSYPFWLYTEASLNLADDDELLELMGRAGFHSVFIGIESPSLESLRESGKHQNMHGDMLSKVHKIQRYGMEVMAGFILGFDQDTEDIFERQMQFISAARIPMAMVGTLSAMPGTQLWMRLKSEGRLRTSWAGDNLGFPNFITAMPALTLVRGYRSVLASLYSPSAFFGRLRDLIDSLEGTRNRTFVRLAPRVRVLFFYRLIKALLILGLVDRHRSEYWRFMFWVWRNHPDKLLFALCRAITGHHFIRYTADIMVPRLNLLEAELAESETNRCLCANDRKSD
jgi:radical SAM superfamily enzyme YgiQ (UPF0313 family)